MFSSKYHFFVESLLTRPLISVCPFDWLRLHPYHRPSLSSANYSLITHFSNHLPPLDS
ncbi:unnamed protein product [Arabidopsis lyrata]|nr:unnamed protein product [Arabidopsis lyrata]